VLSQKERTKTLAKSLGIEKQANAHGNEYADPMNAHPLVEGVPPKFNRMLEVGLPIEAVKNAMQRDGMDPKLLDGTSGQIPSKAPELPEKFARMLKVGLPLPVVENAMRRDGVDPTSFRLNANGDLGNDFTARKVVSKDSFRRFRVHWEVHNNVRSNTLWAMVERDQPWLDGLDIDRDEMSTLFSEERNGKPTLACVVQRTEPGKSVRVIDPKRANNGGILLARIKMSYHEIAMAVAMTDETAFTLEQIKGVMSLIPTADEREALQKHVDSNGGSLSSECEKFMLSMMSVDDAIGKLDAMFFMKRFPVSIEELKSGTSPISLRSGANE
jgi:Formin Homology 2 Domain/Subunit CCDC53 of WASH complex